MTRCRFAPTITASCVPPNAPVRYAGDCSLKGFRSCAISLEDSTEVIEVAGTFRCYVMDKPTE